MLPVARAARSLTPCSSQVSIKFAVLRNPIPAKSQPLLDRGVEVVQGDLDDKAEKVELAQAKNLAEAAAETVALSHYI